MRARVLGLMLVLAAGCRPGPAAPDAGHALIWPDLDAGPPDAGPPDAGYDHSRIDQLLGPDGGGLTLPGGAGLVVPPGALDGYVLLSITGADPIPATELQTLPIGQGFLLEPEGTRFVLPVEVSLPYDPGHLPAGADPARVRVFALPVGDAGVEALQTRLDAAHGQATALCAHLSTWQLGLGDLNVTAPLALGDGVRGQPYGPIQLQASGSATNSYAWSALSLPEGLALSPGGMLAGTPAQSGAQLVAVQVADGAGHAVSAYLGLQVTTPDNPAPTLASLSPQSVGAGTTGLLLQLDGHDFLPSSQVLADGAALVTHSLSAFTLTAEVPDALLASPGAHPVTVHNPAPGGGTSSALLLTVRGPSTVPALSALSPASLPLGTTDAQVTVSGSGIAPDAQLRLNGAPGGGFTLSDTAYSATVPAALLGSSGTEEVALFNPAPGGGLSNSLTLTVGPAGGNPVPSITGLSPSSLAQASSSASFALVVDGAGFIPASTASVDGLTASLAWSSDSEVTLTVPGFVLRGAGEHAVALLNPAPGGGASGAAVLTVTGSNAAPTLSALRPAQVPAGAPDTALTVQGAGFLSNSAVTLNGAPAAWSYQDPATLVVSVGAALLASPGTIAVQVSNPGPGGGSAALGLPVTVDAGPDGGPLDGGGP